MRYKKVEERTIEQIVSSATTCDLCGGNAEASWAYDADEVTIEAKLGNVYPEGDQRRVHEIDVCAKCFVKKVKPAIEALGCKFREREIDDDDRVLGT